MSLLPFLVLANAAVLITLYLASAKSKFRYVVYVLFAVTVVFWALVTVQTGVKQTKTFDMTWSYGDKSRSVPGTDHIRLQFKQYPDEYIGIYSTDLARYLETLPSHDVPVVFRVTTDFGKTRGYNEIQIGTLRSWNTTNGYSETRGNPTSSPWP